MKRNDLQNAVVKAQQELQLAKRKALDLQTKAKAAKAAADRTKLAHKLARKVAKQAKKLAVKSEEEACERTRLLEKAQKRLAKALKKGGRSKAQDAKKATKATGRALKEAAKNPMPSQEPKPAAEMRAPDSSEAEPVSTENQVP